MYVWILHFVTPKIVGFAKEILRKVKLRLLPTDKDGGFALLNEEGHMEAANQVVEDTSKYREIAVNDSSLIDLSEEYNDAVKAISVGNRLFRRALFSDVRCGLRGMIARLQMTVKTHKQHGDVKSRAIHAYFRMSNGTSHEMDDASIVACASGCTSPCACDQ